MSKVRVELSMSLDGFIAGPNDCPENGLGDGGERLFHWYSSGETDFSLPGTEMVFKISRASADFLRESWRMTGASVTGRRTFDIAHGWGGIPPGGSDAKYFVVTHTTPQEWDKPGSPFTFVTTGVEDAVAMHLAAARVMVGVGEATLTPAALSIRGDVFPTSRLGLATGVYYAGIPIGTALSLVVAGCIAPAYGWRACFYVFGLLGLVMVGILLVMPEPRRRTTQVSAETPSLREIVASLARVLRREPALLLVLLGGTALTFWAGSYLLAITWLVQERGFEFRRASFTSWRRP